MICNWRLANFKSIKDRMDQLVLGDLTIFAGANSSGKSTVIQSILLLMQTMANRENVPLQLNGELVSLGQTDDMWHNGEEPETDADEAKYLCLEMILRDSETESTPIFLRLEFGVSREFRGRHQIWG